MRQCGVATNDQMVIDCDRILIALLHKGGTAMISVGTAYLLWLPGCVGLSGLHRFYMGKPITGIIWFLTLGLVGIGHFYDLLTIPRQVHQANKRFGYGPQAVHVHVRNSDRREDDYDDRPRRRR